MAEGKAMKMGTGFRQDFKRRPLLHIFVWFGLIQLLIFHIVPMFGLQVAFREYTTKLSVKTLSCVLTVNPANCADGSTVEPNFWSMDHDPIFGAHP